LKQAKDFTQGNIGKQIVNLALPIMGTAFIQMAYNMTDYFGSAMWEVGRCCGWCAGFFYGGQCICLYH
jgi:hypothetical protein